MQHLPAILGVILITLLAFGSMARCNTPAISLTTRQWDHVCVVAVFVAAIALVILAAMFYMDRAVTIRPYY